MKFLDRDKSQPGASLKESTGESSGISGSGYKEFLYGCAFGDAWGFETEFRKWQEIKEKRPPVPEKLIITDDTQMSIYTLRATLEFFRNLANREFQGSLRGAFQAFSEETGTKLSEKGINYLNEYRRTLSRHYLVYREDPDNNRAPGATVMGSLAEYRKYLEELEGNTKALEGLKGYEGAIDYSTAIGSVLTLGCGSIMRTPVLGVFSDLLSDEALFMLGVVATEPTHRHPLGALVSGLASVLTGKLLTEGKVPLINEELLDYYSELYNDYIELSRELGTPEWVLLKKNDCDYYFNLLEKLSQDSIDLFMESDNNEDICAYAGPGWRADEAFICAYYSLLRYSEEPLEGVRRLVHSSGDSDSIAAVGATWLGALLDYRSKQESKESEHSADTFTYSSYGEFLEDRYRKEISDLVQDIDLLIGEAKN